MGQRLENAKALYLEGIRDGNYEDAINKYTGDFYKQHSTGVKDGKDGFIEFFSDFVKRNPKRDIKIVRALEDDRYVFVQAFQDINDGEWQWVTTDFFDYDNQDKIIEHWDVISAFEGVNEVNGVSGVNESGRSTIDGPTEVEDLDKTSANKALVRNFIQDALMKGGNSSDLGRYISSEQYIQHNKDVPDGLEAFQKLASAPNRPLNYQEIVLLVGQGNFVATLCKANWNDGKTNQDYAQVDLFRIENGKIVEHWDNVEPVPENSVNSGKF